MELSRKTKSTLSVVVCLVFLALVYVGDMLIAPTSSWSMLFTVLEKGSIYALVAVSMNLLNGFTGLFSLGQAGFMMIGAYVYAILSIPVGMRASVYQYFEGGWVQFSVTEILGNALGGMMGEIGVKLGEGLGMIILMVLAGILAALFAALIGFPVLRLKSDYLAIATLGFAEILRAFFQWKAAGPLTNSSNLLRSYTSYDSPLFPVIIAGICIAFIILLINSSYGRALKAIRDDEIAAEAMGVNLFKHKQMSFIISSFFAGVGGALLAMFQSSVASTPFTSNMTYELLLIVVIGGIGSITGSIIGSFLFVASSEWWLRGLDAGKFLGIEADFMRPGFRKVVFAIIIMGIVLFYSRGIMGTKEFSWEGFLGFFKNLPQRIINLPAKIKGNFSNKRHKTDTEKVKEAQ
ncbi:MAG: branched-chain amino acid ABC transporter permease [Firmicutes bacterium]|nr:branched-chain amino acid ABC transporter permease [Bacillota bacterium]